MGAEQGKGCCNMNTEPYGTEIRADNQSFAQFRQTTQFLANQSPNKQSKFLNSIFDRSSNENLRLMKLQQLSELQNPPTLILKVLSSPIISKGIVLKITPLGLLNSKRAAQDGYTYFGSKRKGERDNKCFKSQIINDFVLPYIDQSNIHRGRHFMIYFSVDTMNFRIKDLGLGFGVFYRLDRPLVFLFLWGYFVVEIKGQLFDQYWIDFYRCQFH